MMYKIVFFLMCLGTIVFADESQLIVVRHGEGTHNLTRKYNSNPYHPNYFRADLTEKGKKDVLDTAAKLLEKGFNKDTIDLVIVSPLPRTLQTAKILYKQGVFSKEKMIIDARVIEPQMGDFEGRVSLSIPWPTMDHKSFQGETVEEMKKRIKSVYEDIVKKKSKGHVLVVTHGTPGQFLLNYVTGKEYTMKTAEAIVIPLK